MTIIVRQAGQNDRTAWDVLFEAYCQSGGQEQTPEMRDRVWHWIMDPNAQTRCFVVEGDKDALVGFIHFRSYERPMPATVGAYIDDIYVAPAARGRGVVDAILKTVGDFAKEQGWDVVRWMTSETNYRARAVYDRHAQKSSWITYQLNS